MARTASPAHRQHLEQMAETWEQLAEARKRCWKKTTKPSKVITPPRISSHNWCVRREPGSRP